MAMVAALIMGQAAQADIITVVTDNGDGVACSDLVAGQNTVVGSVCVVADEVGLCFTYSTTGNWFLQETHLWAGQNISEMPQNRKGNPKIGQFPYGEEDLYSQDYQVCIPYEVLGLTPELICEEDQLVLFAAHAALYKLVAGEVVQEETGWSDGAPITDKGSWAMYGSVTLTCERDDPDPPPTYGDCETAFAFGPQQLNTLPDPLDPTKPLTARWGWQNGPILPGEVVVKPIFAAAGQNTPSNGTHVGYLFITYNANNTVTVVYDMLEGFVMTETHLYVGHSNIETAAPGQFGHSHENLATDNDVFEIEVDNPGEAVFVVAHAVVCEVLD